MNLRQSTPSFLLAILLVFGFGSAQAQCDSLLSFSSPEPALNVTIGQLEGSGPWSGLLKVSSLKGGSFSLRLGALIDAGTGQALPAGQLELTPGTLELSAGKSREISLSVSGPLPAGSYAGELVIEQTNGACFRNVPVTLSFKEKNCIHVLDSSQTLTLRSISPPWLTGLLPTRIRNRQISFTLENQGEDPILIDSFSLAMRGAASGNALTEADLKWLTTDKKVPARGLKVLQFRLAPREMMAADEYAGPLRVYFQNEEPVTVSVKLFTRSGIGWAIVALVLGIFLGRIIRDLNKAQDQMILTGKIIPLRAKVDQIDDTLARNQLREELKAVEAKAETVANAEQRTSIEETDLAPIEKKIQQMQQLESLFQRIDETLQSVEFPPATGAQIEQEFKVVRDLILAGKDEEVKAGLTRIQDLIAAVAKTGSRDLAGGDMSGATRSIGLEIDKITELLKQKEAGGETEETALERAERIFLRVLAFLSGVRVTARVRFALFRPLVALATFLIVLLLGFEQIYINGSDTFGVNGIYDYLQLFLWGVISDVFARSLVENPLVTSFTNR